MMAQTPQATEERAEAIGLHNLKPAPGSQARTASASAAATAPATARRPAAATRATARAPAPRTARASRAARTRSTCGCASCAARTRRCRCRSSRSGRTRSRSTSTTSRRASTTAPSVDLEALRGAGLATRKRDVPVKILGRGELTKPLTVHAHEFSKSARERIEAAGGTCQVVELSQRTPRALHDPQLLPGPGDPQEARSSRR